jgi:hypothetical protein
MLPALAILVILGPQASSDCLHLILSNPPKSVCLTLSHAIVFFARSRSPHFTLSCRATPRVWCAQPPCCTTPVYIRTHHSSPPLHFPQIRSRSDRVDALRLPIVIQGEYSSSPFVPDTTHLLLHCFPARRPALLPSPWTSDEPPTSIAHCTTRPPPLFSLSRPGPLRIGKCVGHRNRPSSPLLGAAWRGSRRTVGRARPCWVRPGVARGARPAELALQPAWAMAHGPGEIPASRPPLPLFSVPSVEEEVVLCLCVWEEGDEKKPTVQLGFGKMPATLDPTPFHPMWLCPHVAFRVASLRPIESRCVV